IFPGSETVTFTACDGDTSTVFVVDILSRKASEFTIRRPFELFSVRSYAPHRSCSGQPSRWPQPLHEKNRETSTPPSSYTSSSFLWGTRSQLPKHLRVVSQAWQDARNRLH